MINSDETARGVTNTCNAFRSLREAYESSSDPREALVLQALPLSLVAHQDALAILDPTVAAHLAKEVYDRGPEDFTEKDGEDVYTPCIELEEELPHRVQFRLTETPISALGEDDLTVHVAYAVSANTDWIVASWIHKTGRFQASVPYCLQDREFVQVAEEIWETTMSANPQLHTNFTIYLSKAGIMTLDEKKMWKDLSNRPREGQVSVYILSVNPNPTLQLSVRPSPSDGPATVPPTPSTFEAQQQSNAMYSTPISTSTPLSFAQSPAASTPTISRTFFATSNAAKTASTPPASSIDHSNQAAMDADPTARLIDIVDETWGMVLAHRLNVSSFSPRLHQALASGYLMKRSCVGDIDPPVLCEVNLMVVHAQSQMLGQGADGEQAHYDAVLRDILGMYRGLGTLARARGIVDERSVVPWHVATASRAAVGLGACLPMGKRVRGAGGLGLLDLS